MTDFTFASTDGYELAASWFPGARGAVLISSGTGIRRQFYSRLASFLQQRGFSVMTYDYRGIGGSRRGSLRGFQADKLTWAERDMRAAWAELGRRAGGVPLYWFGHSLGGQMPGLVQGIERAEAICTVGTGVGIWWKMLKPYRWFCLFVWYVYMPLMTALFGYAPARLIRQGQDLPRGVALQWSLWCRSKDYFGKYLGQVRLERMAVLRQPWWSIGFTDDPIANWQTIPQMMRFYPRVDLRFDMITPGELGLPAVGHHGFFRPGCEALWERLVVFYENAGKPESSYSGKA
ncbi:MAG: alpha/beta fold hydrolase [Candidatus Eremiobacteraeota bacterium]|nr:alpha/beta fold hydrolase [Candidatus Eremiobacteraeota bacterium]MCW5872012.1 alpha/beta fold hydrolase [Candidatus Eremiobacteraeota bacterium]